jgi:mxaJ protein
MTFPAQTGEANAAELPVTKGSPSQSSCVEARQQSCLFLRAHAHLILLLAGVFVLSHQAAALNVCADPDYLPYSNHAGQGFENKVAATVAHALGENVQYAWASYRGRGGFSQFLSSTLDARKCDVVMSMPYGSREELTTQPYYISSYVFVFPKSKQYSISSIDSPALKGLRIGFEHDTPAQESLKLRSLIGKSVGFDIADDPEQSPAIMLKALTTGKIDVLITWQPSIGAFLRNYPALEVVPVPNTRTLGAPEQFSFPMSMAVRTGDQAMKEKLDRVIEKHRAELESVLSRGGIRSFAPEVK